jgi:hypothetical protein
LAAERPVQFEITEQTRESVEVWIKAAGLLPSGFLFPGRIETFAVSRQIVDDLRGFAIEVRRHHHQL